MLGAEVPGRSTCGQARRDHVEEQVDRLQGDELENGQ